MPIDKGCFQNSIRVNDILLSAEFSRWIHAVLIQVD